MSGMILSPVGDGAAREARATSFCTLLTGVLDEEEFARVAIRRTAPSAFVASLSETSGVLAIADEVIE
jgi:hypothetical protein